VTRGTGAPTVQNGRHLITTQVIQSHLQASFAMSAKRSKVQEPAKTDQPSQLLD